MDEGARLARFVARRTLTFLVPTHADVARVPAVAHPLAVAIWQRRHANERASVALAERMLARAQKVGADGWSDALVRFAEDERRHVEAVRSALGALDAPGTVAATLAEPPVAEADALSLARDIVVGVAVCETISAARFANVRASTDIPGFRALIDGFLRDEVAHAGLGFALTPSARALAHRVCGADGDSWLVVEIVRAMCELELVVGLDGERAGLAPRRPQPAHNPGIVEPNIDALAFYEAVERRILPRFTASGLLVERAWRSRFTTRALTAS